LISRAFLAFGFEKKTGFVSRGKVERKEENGERRRR
jgi:hypothetical protein